MFDSKGILGKEQSIFMFLFKMTDLEPLKWGHQLLTISTLFGMPHWRLLPNWIPLLSSAITKLEYSFIDKYTIGTNFSNAISSKNNLSKSLRGQGKFLHNLSCNIEGRKLSSPFDVALALIEANFPASLLYQKQQKSGSGFILTLKQKTNPLLLIMVKLNKP